MLRAIDLVARERSRQIKVHEFLTADDAEIVDELVIAAQAYSWAGLELIRLKGSGMTPKERLELVRTGRPHYWPWDESDWNPSVDAGENLVRAAALLTAATDGWDHKTQTKRKDEDYRVTR